MLKVIFCFSHHVCMFLPSVMPMFLATCSVTPVVFPQWTTQGAHVPFPLIFVMMPMKNLANTYRFGYCYHFLASVNKFKN